MFILKFLVPLKASFILFSVMGKDPSPEQSKIQATNAANVDAIAQRLEDQFLAQATLNDFDEVTKTPMKKVEFGGVTKEPIKFFKALLGAASKNGGDNMDEGMSRQRHGGTLAWEPPLTVSRLKCLGPCMKRRVFIGFTSVS